MSGTSATFSSTLGCSGAFIQLNQTELFASAGNRAWAFGLGYQTAGDFVLMQGTTASGGTYTPKFTISPTGNVLIGTTTDSAGVRLKVAGGIIGCLDVYNNTTGVGANLNIDANGFFARSTSSKKYKKNINNLTKGLNEVLQLRAVTYNSIKENETQTYGGLIAEEVHDLGLTEFVQYAEDGTPDALSYPNMIALLTKAIQEQQAIIEDLKARIEKLEV